MSTQYNIIINGNAFDFTQGETILDVARRNGIDIPTLCFLKNSQTSGNCGICVVEVSGASGLKNSCSTFAEHRMNVLTESPLVITSRREKIKRFLSSGNHNCAISRSDGMDWTRFQLKVHNADQSRELCPVWGDCRLQDLAYRYQVTSELPLRKDISYPIENINPFIVRDFSRCILCGKCVRACQEIQVNDAIQFDNPTTPDKIVTPNDTALKDSECVFCGECIQACPVGALVEKDTRYAIRQWETEKVRTTCSYCGVGCQLNLHVKDNTIVKVTGVEDQPPNYGSLCVKGRFGYNFVNSPERLTKPQIKENGVFRDAEWDEAITFVADKLNQLKKDHGADSIGVLTSARITNEENYVAHKFARGVIKTNNIDHCARL